MKNDIEQYLDKFRLKKQTSEKKISLLANAKSAWENEKPIFSHATWLFLKISSCCLLVLLLAGIILNNNENQKMQEYTANYHPKIDSEIEEIINFYQEFGFSRDYSRIATLIQSPPKEVDLNNILENRKQILIMLKNGDKS